MTHVKPRVRALPATDDEIDACYRAHVPLAKARIAAAKAKGSAGRPIDRQLVADARDRGIT